MCDFDAVNWCLNQQAKFWGKVGRRRSVAVVWIGNQPLSHCGLRQTNRLQRWSDYCLSIFELDFMDRDFLRVFETNSSFIGNLIDIAVQCG